MKKYRIVTLGCKVNQSESESIARALENGIWRAAANNEEADAVIINTCTVTARASAQSGNAIRSAVKKNPRGRIVVTGCHAQAAPDEILKIEGVDDIACHAEKQNIPGLLLETKKALPLSALDIQNRACTETVFQKMPAPSTGSRTRPFLKIQDGCNAFCSYCIVPHARGRSRSLPPDEVIASLRHYSQEGYREAVLTGVHIGQYGKDLNPPSSLYQLLKRADELAVIDRIRLGSVEPRELTDDIIDLTADSSILCSHFHIPLQSGDNEILERMRRPYTSGLFMDIILKIKEKIPDAAVGVDIIAGFPGESDAAFENTYSLVEELPVTYLHVFPFSPRAGTPAAKFGDQVPASVLKERTERLRELGRRKKENFYRSIAGREIEVLVEKKRDRKTGLLKGITSNYVSTVFEGGDDLANGFAWVRGESVHEGRHVMCSMIDKKPERVS